MSPRTQRLPILALVAVLAALGLHTVPAQAADPIPTVTNVNVSGGDKAGDTAYVTVNVKSASGTPTGSVVFTGAGNGTPVTLNFSGIGQIQIVLASNDPFTVSAAFTGTNGYADSIGTTTFKPLQKLYLHAEPTVLKLLPGSFKLTLTMSAYTLNAVGGGLPGRKITFTLFDPYPLFLERNRALVVCTAISDANGLATCGGFGTLGAIVSILSGGAYATYTPGAILPAYDIVKLPVVMQG